MSGLDEIAPSFLQAKDRWPDAPNLQSHYVDLASTFENSGSSLIELCKSFLEMVCITVLRELGEPKLNNASTTHYVTKTLEKLGIKNMRGASAFDKVLSAHNKLADGLSDVRNQEGTVAHGKDGFIDTLSDRHARVYLLTTDTILTLILEAFDGKDPSILDTREPHDRFCHLNDRIDAFTAINSEVDEKGMLVVTLRPGILEDGFDLIIPASELLYHLDRQAYVDVLDTLKGVSAEGEEGEGGVEETPEGQEIQKKPKEDVAETPKVETDSRRHLEVETEYTGRYADQVNALYEYIIHNLLGGKEEEATQVLNLIYSLLDGMEELAVIDWSKRNSTRSAVRLFVRKLVKLVAIEGMGADSIEEIGKWLVANISGEDQ